MVAVSDFSGLVSSACALASAAAIAPMVSLDRCIARLHAAQQIKTDCPRFGPLGADAMAEGFLGVLWHQDFEFSSGLLMVQEGRAGLAKHPPNSAQELDALISTILTAAIRGRGGST